MCATDKPAVRAALDKVEELHTVFAGFDCLLSADAGAISGSARDDVAMLHYYLIRRHNEALAELRAAVFTGASPC